MAAVYEFFNVPTKLYDEFMHAPREGGGVWVFFSGGGDFFSLSFCFLFLGWIINRENIRKALPVNTRGMTQPKPRTGPGVTDTVVCDTTLANEGITGLMAASVKWRNVEWCPDEQSTSPLQGITTGRARRNQKNCSYHECCTGARGRQRASHMVRWRCIGLGADEDHYPLAIRIRSAYVSGARRALSKGPTAASWTACPWMPS